MTGPTVPAGTEPAEENPLAVLVVDTDRGESPFGWSEEDVLR